jgi:hypothetical protein
MLAPMIPSEVISTARVVAPLLSSALAGSILTLSYFSIPIIRSVALDQSTARGLDHLKGLFSSGSHIYPQGAALAGALYALLAYTAPAGSAVWIGYGVAAAGCLGIAPFTTMIMLPAANQALLDLYEKRKNKGGVAVEGDTQKVDALLKKFMWLNAVRAGIMAGGAVAGLYTTMVL